MKPKHPNWFINIAALTCVLIAAACQRPPIPSMPQQVPVVLPTQPAPPDQPADNVEIAEIPKPIPTPPPAPPKPVINRSLPESIIGFPDKDPATRQLAYNTKIGTRSAEAAEGANWHYRRTNVGEIVGFEFSNHGGNLILPPSRDAARNQFYTRDFQFRFDDRARQDISLVITDWAPSRDRQFRLSELMHSVLHFFPRRYLPAIASFDGRHIITLPTGEEVSFDARTHEIKAGVFSEAPVDLNPERRARRFPAVAYSGKGILVRADARGADPRIGTIATITNGSPPPLCDKGAACSQCQVPARELWDQSGALRFKFATDAEFDRFLRARCQFGLPQIEDPNPGAPRPK